MIALLLALAVLREEAAEMGPWREDGDGRAAEFTIPKRFAGRWARVVLDRPAAVRVNGTLLPGGPLEFDAGDHVAWNAPNRIWVRGSATARVLWTPRAYISGERIEWGRGGTRIDVAIRNTLENTVNLIVEARRRGAAEACASEVATVGPGVSQTVVLRGRCGEPSVLELTIDKEAEAMEGAYRFFRLSAPPSGTGTGSKL